MTALFQITLHSPIQISSIQMSDTREEQYMNSIVNAKLKLHSYTLACLLYANSYRNRSNFHGTNISRIPKMDSICDFIFTNPPLHSICDCILENRPYCHISYFEKYRF